MKFRNISRKAKLLYFFCLLTASGGFSRVLPSRTDEATHKALADVCSSTGSDRTLSSIKEQISHYLDTMGHDGKFHIQGWRWHTMSLVRETGRLHRFARSLSNSFNEKDVPALVQGVNYVVGFNMKGLHKIESDLFFPWVRKKLRSVTENKAHAAYEVLMDRLENERKAIEALGSSIKQEAVIASDSSFSMPERNQAVESVADLTAKVVEHARAMLDLEDTMLVPTIAQLVPESEQKSFNNQVIRNLGVLDSRLHLVGMHEAVWELNDDNERQLFDEAIPSIPRMLIPRWKRLLYQPQAGVLDTR